jgi:hypothetical protein
MRPQDVVVLLKILTLPYNTWQNKDLADSLGISQSEVTESLNRSDLARLFNKSIRKPNRNNLYDFLVHGLPYVFPQLPGTLVRGIPTAHSHAAFTSKFNSEIQYVWPYPKGETMGLSIEPFYRNQVNAALNDKDLYLLLACLDVMRVGKVREKEYAIDMLKNKILHELPGEHNQDQSGINSSD